MPHHHSFCFPLTQRGSLQNIIHRVTKGCSESHNSCFVKALSDCVVIQTVKCLIMWLMWSNGLLLETHNHSRCRIIFLRSCQSFLPEASFGLRVLSLPASVCVCVCLSVCLSVCQSLACPGDNSGPVQARIAKFGPKMQKTLVKAPIVFGGNWPWPSRSNLTSKSEFTQFWACPDHNSLPIQARITKFGPEVENSLVKVPIVLGGNWPRPSRSNLI